MTIKDIGPEPTVFDIEDETTENDAYRRVAWSGKYLQVTGEREQAVAALRERARQTQDALDDMEIDLIANPGKYSAKQLRSARRKADRAQEALLLAEAGVSRF